jgi:hypothetical protein
MIFNAQNKLPKVRLKPYRKYLVYIAGFYFDHKIAIILGYNKLIAVFENILVVLKSENKKYLKLLFGMLCNRTINSYKDILNDKIHIKIHNILEHLYDINDEFEDEETHITISDNGIIAYLVKETQILYYKYTKYWHKDKTINLLGENEELEEEVYGKFINDRYYVFYKQFLEDVEIDDDYEDEDEEDRKHSYKLEHKEEVDVVVIYDLHTGDLIHEAITCSHLQDGYYRPFEFVSIDYPIPFFINDKIVLRPVVLVLDDCGDSKVIITSPDSNKTTRKLTLGSTQSILTFFYSDNKASYGSAVAITSSYIWLYEIHNDLIKIRDINIPDKIDINKCSYYKHKNLFIIYDGNKQFIAIYYRVDKSKYYCEVIHSKEYILEKNGIAGYIMNANNPEDCIGLALYSKKGVLSVIVYDSNSDSIKHKQINYDIMALGDKGKLSLLKAIAGRLTKNNFILKLLQNVSFLKQFNSLYSNKEDYGLNIIVGDIIKAFINYYSSPIDLQAKQYYVFENRDTQSYRWAEQVEDCICIYEQPCIVKFLNTNF